MINFYREFPVGERGRKYHSEYIPELRTDNKRYVPNGFTSKGTFLGLKHIGRKGVFPYLFRLPTEPAHVIVLEDSVLYLRH